MRRHWFSRRGTTTTLVYGLAAMSFVAIKLSSAGWPHSAEGAGTAPSDPHHPMETTRATPRPLPALEGWADPPLPQFDFAMSREEWQRRARHLRQAIWEALAEWDQSVTSPAGAGRRAPQDPMQSMDAGARNGDDQGLRSPSLWGDGQATGGAGGSFALQAITNAAVAPWAADSLISGAYANPVSDDAAALPVIRVTHDTTFRDRALSGVLRADPGTVTTLAGTITNADDLVIQCTVRGQLVEMALAGDVTFAGGAATTFADPAQVTGDGGWLINAAGHTIDGAWQFQNLAVLNQGTLVANGGAAGNQLVAAPAGLVNQGVLRVDAGTVMTVAGAITQTAGTLNVNGTLSADQPVDVQGGVLSGRGVIVAEVHVSGTIAPGNSIGTLTIDGNVIFDAGGRLLVELGADGLSDLLVVNGDLDLSGGLDRLEIIQVAGTTFAGPYTVLTCTGTVTGQFDAVTPGYTIEYDAGTGEIRVMSAVPEPGTLVLLGTGLWMVLWRNRRRG